MSPKTAYRWTIKRGNAHNVETDPLLEGDPLRSAVMFVTEITDDDPGGSLTSGHDLLCEILACKLSLCSDD
jgi:hypothetical protein